MSDLPLWVEGVQTDRVPLSLYMQTRRRAPARWGLAQVSARLIDGAITAALLLWALPDAPWPWRPPGHVPPLPKALAIVGLLLLQTIPFLWRRHYPGLVLCTSLVALVGRWALGLDVVSAIAAA
jgi:uncharacterized RDD family membrane protein YckC